MMDTPPTRFGDATGWRKPRPRVVAAVVLLHVALGWAIVVGLGGVQAAAEKSGLAPLVRSYTVVEPKPPPPPPRAEPLPDAGAAAPAGRKARPKPAPPPPRIVIQPRIETPPVSGSGAEMHAGAVAAGPGTGAGGTGSGTGGGSGGAGQGGGAASPAVKIAGDITAARDYPPDPEGKRLGRSVIVALTVGTDGRVSACRVRQPSGDPDADATTCRLAQQRFRFRPAVDAEGRPVEALYGWKQSWFRP